MLVIGLTGNIASGKSYVAGLFQSLGAKVLDADLTAKRLLWKNSPCFDRICRTFGKDILTRDHVDRKKLAKIVFTDPKKRTQLENIIHPMVKMDFKRRIDAYRRENRCRILVLDVPLLFETGMQILTDKTIVVKATRNQQIDRSGRLGKFDKAEVLRRLSAQMSQTDKIRLADFCIDNTKDKRKTKLQVKELWQKLQQITKK